MARVILGKYIGVKVPEGLTGKEKEEHVIADILSRSTVKVSERDINERARRMAEEYALRLTQQGLSIEQYYAASHTNEKELVNRMKELAKKQLKGRMLLTAIAKKEGIAATEEDFDREIEKLTIRYPLGREEVKRVIQGEEAKRLRDEIAVKKAMDFILEHTAK